MRSAGEAGSIRCCSGNVCDPTLLQNPPPKKVTPSCLRSCVHEPSPSSRCMNRIEGQKPPKTMCNHVADEGPRLQTRQTMRQEPPLTPPQRLPGGYLEVRMR